MTIKYIPCPAFVVIYNSFLWDIVCMSSNLSVAWLAFCITSWAKVSTCYWCWVCACACSRLCPTSTRPRAYIISAKYAPATITLHETSDNHININLCLLIIDIPFTFIDQGNELLALIQISNFETLTTQVLSIVDNSSNDMILMQIQSWPSIYLPVTVIFNPMNWLWVFPLKNFVVHAFVHFNFNLSIWSKLDLLPVYMSSSP